VRVLYRLESDRGHVSREQQLEVPARGVRELEERQEDLALLELAVLVPGRRVDLEHELRARDRLVARVDDRGAHLAVRLVVEPGGRARVGLDHDPVALAHEVAHRDGNQGRPRLAHVRLADDANVHDC